MSSSSGSSAAALESWSCGFAVAVEAILPDRRLWSMAVSNQASMGGEESCCRPPARRLSCRRHPGLLTWVVSAGMQTGDGDPTHWLPACIEGPAGWGGGRPLPHSCRRAAHAVAAAETGRPPLHSQRLGGRGPLVTSSSLPRCCPPAARASPPELAPSRACAVSNSAEARVCKSHKHLVGAIFCGFSDEPSLHPHTACCSRSEATATAHDATP